MRKLPYRAKTAMGDVYDIEFPLHGDTGDAVRVGQLVTALLDAIDRDVAIGGSTSNGDVLQALAMSLAIRARMIHAPPEVTEKLAKQLLDTALDAVEASTHHSARTGHA